MHRECRHIIMIDMFKVRLSRGICRKLHITKFQKDGKHVKSKHQTTQIYPGLLQSKNVAFIAFSKGPLEKY